MKTAYFSAKGEVLLVVESPGMAAPERAVFEAEVADDVTANDIYFDDGVHAKAELDLNISRNLIAGIPPGSRLLYDGQMIVIDDGSFEIDTAVEELLTVYIDHPHHTPGYFQVNTGP